MGAREVRILYWGFSPRQSELSRGEYNLAKLADAPWASVLFPQETEALFLRICCGSEYSPGRNLLSTVSCLHLIEKASQVKTKSSGGRTMVMRALSSDVEGFCRCERLVSFLEMERHPSPPTRFGSAHEVKYQQ